MAMPTPMATMRLRAKATCPSSLTKGSTTGAAELADDGDELRRLGECDFLLVAERRGLVRVGGLHGIVGAQRAERAVRDHHRAQGDGPESDAVQGTLADAEEHDGQAHAFRSLG